MQPSPPLSHPLSLVIYHGIPYLSRMQPSPLPHLLSLCILYLSSMQPFPPPPIPCSALHTITLGNLDTFLEETNYFDHNTTSLIFTALKIVFKCILGNVKPVKIILGGLTEVISSWYVTKVLLMLWKSSFQYHSNRDEIFFISPELLLMVHALGKEGNNLFTVTQKNLAAAERASDNPVHGFRRDLVRLIGNLSYRCKTSQDLVSTVYQRKYGVYHFFYNRCPAFWCILSVYIS